VYSIILKLTVHTSIRSVDHLSELLKKTSQTFKNLTTTKCSAIIRKIIAPCMLEELLEDLNKKYYSLIVDEYRYFCNKVNGHMCKIF
jgi:hypothetical protein